MVLPQLPCNNFYHLNSLLKAASKNVKSHLCHLFKPTIVLWYLQWPSALTLILECFRVYNNPNITVHFNTETMDTVSNTKGQMSGILLKNLCLRQRGYFMVLVIHRIASCWMACQVEFDSSGYVLGEKGIANELDQNVHFVIYYYINHSPLEKFFCNLLHLCIIYKFKY